jgi:hypothetical protein
MGTTDLFVELVVIGIGALVWIVVSTFSIFGYEWVPLEQVFSISSLIPFLSLIYIVGIITDRIADTLFGRIWVPKISKRYYASSEDETEDRRIIYSTNEYLANLIEYGRSRLRICRGWAFNSFLIMIASTCFIIAQIHDVALTRGLLVWINVVFGFITIFSWYSWYQLTDTQYRRVKGEADFIRRQNTKKKPT